MKFFNKIKDRVIKILKQGTSPKELAFCVAGSAVLGVFPVLGSTTILVTLFATIFKLNLPTAQLVNLTVYPLQLFFLVPFMVLGEMLFGLEKISLSFSEMINMLEENMMETISLLLYAAIQGILAWLLLFPLITYTLYFFLKRTFEYVKLRMNN